MRTVSLKAKPVAHGSGPAICNIPPLPYDAYYQSMPDRLLTEENRWADMKQAPSKKTHQNEIPLFSLVEGLLGRLEPIEHPLVRAQHGRRPKSKNPRAVLGHLGI